MMMESATGICVPGEAMMRKSAAPEFVMSRSMAGESASAKTVSGESMARKSMTGELVMTSRRVSRETPTLAASVMPAVMMPSTVVTMADPTTSGPSTTLAATGPTVLTEPAVTAVTGEFKAGPAAEALAVPATIHSSTGAIEALVSRIAPGELRSVARATQGSCAPVWTKTVWTKTVWTKTLRAKTARTKVAWTRAERLAPASAAGTRSTTPRLSSAFTSAIFSSSSFRSTAFRPARAGFPGDVAIRTALRAAIGTHVAAFLAVAPIGIARATLVSRVAPFRSLPTFAIDWTTTLAHALFVSTIFVPASIPLFAGLIVALSGLIRAMPPARSSVGRLPHPAVTACRTTLLGAGIVTVCIFVRGVGHFVSSNFTGWNAAPIVLHRELQHGRCCDPS
jgi:hypothetical protein